MYRQKGQPNNIAHTIICKHNIFYLAPPRFYVLSDKSYTGTVSYVTIYFVYTYIHMYMCIYIYNMYYIYIYIYIIIYILPSVMYFI